jgi:glucose-6-phosphate isomerase
MNAAIDSVIVQPAWKALCAHHESLRGLQLRQLFADDLDLERGERMALEEVGIYFDYSKNRVTE